MQVVEMHHVVMHVEGSLHDVADHFRIGGYLDSQCVLHRTDGGQGVYRGAYPAGSLYEGPDIPGVPSFYYIFKTPYHGAGTVGICYFAIFHLNLDSEVPLDSRDGIYYDSISHDCWFIGNL